MNERHISLFEGMVDALWEVYKYCCRNKQHDFTRKQVKHLFTNENEVARFGDWLFFGGLVYRPDRIKGHYGLNMQRCWEFFTGKLAIHSSVWKNPITHELRYDELRTISQIPALKDFMNSKKEFTVEYAPPKQEAML